MTRRSIHFNVRPRYTSGSPAMVPEGIALRVADEERKAMRGALDGYYGAEEANRAATLGLDRVAEECYETAQGVVVKDLCTGETYLRAKRYKAVARIQVFDEKRGWLPATVHKDDGYMILAHVEPKAGEWRPPVALERRYTRLVSSIIKPETVDAPPKGSER